ncbi:hypothetical protein Ae201684P_019987 [Aphanomyces euteiches]|uniref:PH domain-containing protein n=1 Tax=Aphanomyces euteiches TaxID=100861 RepID=A0A6G0WBX1_9STRA|nr:hypothetical protein Ae201684_016622 [Aphanomyces euteiches]KAH9078924.1 hypothetical protein Ae201684P_019987 [Aphanomyces euteiches]KAH9131970.1 hypothetical protein AeRB84_021493 [Aphanomyces euteiches]
MIEMEGHLMLLAPGQGGHVHYFVLADGLLRMYTSRDRSEQLQSIPLTKHRVRVVAMDPPPTFQLSIYDGRGSSTQLVLLASSHLSMMRWMHCLAKWRRLGFAAPEMIDQCDENIETLHLLLKQRWMADEASFLQRNKSPFWLKRQR